MIRKPFTSSGSLGGWPRRSLASAIVLGTLGTAAIASATVRREGEWPDADKLVTIDVTTSPRAEAIRKVAEAAGWNVVVQAPPGEPVDIHVKGVPARKVLELLLADGDYVAKRDGNLIDIHRAEPMGPGAGNPSGIPAIPPMPPTPPIPPIPPMAGVSVTPPNPDPHPEPHPATSREAAREAAKAARGKHGERGEDRVVTGGSLRIEKGEVVHDVAVFGGSVDVYGTVKGDIAVMGGSARVHKGAHVEGDATAIGGMLRIEDGAQVDGDAAVVGGALIRDDGAEVGGKTVSTDKRGISIEVDGEEGPSVHKGIQLGHIGSQISSALTSAALLFVFGAVLLALGARRMEALQAEVASRPMRTFALGVVGFIAACAALIAMCLTIVGIPFALIGVLIAVFAAYAGLASVLTTAGAALLGHRTKSPYAHLALGCALFLLLGAIPYVGDVLTTVATVMGIGVLVATKAAASTNPSQGPYRTAV